MLAAPASAVITPVAGADTPPNDVLALLFPTMDELGDPGVFPLGERILHATLGATALIAAPATNGPAANFLVEITNLQPFSLYNVHYTCNPGTGFSNIDGTINGLIAFKLDYAGVNIPLVFESMTPDAIFETGETWRFIVDDYASGVGPPDGFFGIGVPDGAGPPSSVNLVADLVPEPGSMGLLALGALAIAGRRSRKA